MPRNFGRYTTSIHQHEDFRALTFAQQGVYFMLGLQGEISAAGTLPLRPRRWTRNAADGPDELEPGLKILTEIGHIAVDEETEELLVTKFVKFDGGYQNSKRLPVVRQAALEIESPHLRRILSRELAKLGLSDIASELIQDAPSDTAADSQSDSPSNPPPDTPSDALSPSDRVVVKERNHIPQPTTLNPEGEPPRTAYPIPPDDSADPAPPSMFCSKHPEGTERPCGACADARKRYAAHAQAKTDREVEARRARAQAIASCQLCDEHGKRLDPKTRLPTGRCTHMEVSS